VVQVLGAGQELASFLANELDSISGIWIHGDYETEEVTSKWLAYDAIVVGASHNGLLLLDPLAGRFHA
jgi:menaquinone-dependent protoporphyrinogen IX oxidase